MSLDEMFIKNKGEALNINGSLVEMSKILDVKKGQDVQIEFITTKNNYRQGIELSLDKRKGYIEINNQKFTYPTFWTDTAPSTFVFKCYPKKQLGQLNIWNIWNVWEEYDDRVDAWIGNAGIIVEQESDNTIILRCSSGVGDIDFEDLVLRVSLL